MTALEELRLLRIHDFNLPQAHRLDAVLQISPIRFAARDLILFAKKVKDPFDQKLAKAGQSKFQSLAIKLRPRN